jgi:hypothetical protein
MLKHLNEKQAACLENAAWYVERAAAHPVLRPYFLEMAACWEGLARNFVEQASRCGTSEGSPAPPNGAMGRESSLQGRPMIPTSSACTERATETEDAARRIHDTSSQQSLHRIADAWRRLGAAYKLAEEVRKSAQ